MSELKIAALLLGGAVGAAGAILSFLPSQARRWTTAFPRSRPAAWALTAVDLLWSAWLVYQMPLGPADRFKDCLYILMPAAFVLIIFFMDDLLASRALGGLLLLASGPLLGAARLHDSPWHVVVSALAYVLVVAGIVLVLNPYQFRKGMSVLASTDDRCRMAGSACLGVGICVILLGLLFY